MKSEKTDNELIAEFMNLPANYEDGSGFVHTNFKGNEEWGFNNDELEYSTSWDWLMPVVEKIYKVQPSAFRISLEDGPLSPLAELHVWDEIEKWYKAVVEFIKWYNSQQTTI